MKCEDYQELISLYVDDLLTVNEKKQLEEHLEHCLSCRETLEILLMMKSGMHEIEEVEVPKTFHDDLHKRLRQGHKPKKQPYKWTSYVAGLVAALFIGFMFIDGGISQNQPIQDAPTPMTISLGDDRAAPMTIENQAANLDMKSREIQAEEVWQTNCIDLKEAETFLEDYANQHDMNMMYWEVGSEHHWLLEPIEDKEVFKNILEAETWVDGTLQVVVMDAPRVHLILNVQE